MNAIAKIYRTRDAQIEMDALDSDRLSLSGKAIAFQPQSLLLASAAEDGWLCLWQKGSRLAQILKGAPAGFTWLAWSPGGEAIAAGGHQGEVLVWTETTNKFRQQKSMLS